MHRSIPILALTAWLPFGGAAPAPQGTPAAGMVIESGAGAFVERGGTRTALALGELIYAGDRLVTGAVSATLLFCPTCERITLGKRTTAEVAAAAVAVRTGPALVRTKAEQCALPRVALGQESLERIGGLRARGYPPIALYLGGPIRASRPTFEWGPVAGAETFRLSLRSETGADLWEFATAAQRAGYPAQLAPLTPGAYEWEVRALAQGKPIAQQAASLEVRPAEGAAAEPTDAAGRLLAAVAAENLGYWAEAAAHYRALRETRPRDLRFTRRLAWLYWNAGLIAAAAEEIKKLPKSR